MTFRHGDHRHDTVSQARECESGGITKTIDRNYPAPSEAQLRFIGDLIADRVPADPSVLPKGHLGFLVELQDKIDRQALGKREASFAITTLKSFPRIDRPAPVGSVAEAAQPFERPARPVATITQDGMYRNPETGEIFKLQFNRASGDGRRLYAKILVMWVKGQQITAPGADTARTWNRDRDSVEFQYAPGAVQTLRPEWRMTMAQAREFGALYGTCVRCSRTLTAEDSIERMMGPVCARKGNWA